MSGTPGAPSTFADAVERYLADVAAGADRFDLAELLGGVDDSIRAVLDAAPSTADRGTGEER